MFDWVPQEVLDFFTIDTLIRLGSALLFGVIAFVILKLFVFLLARALRKRMSDQSVMVVRKLITYFGLTVILLVILAQLGVSLATILGAAGIAGIALGFAAQTSVGNVISGLFLMSEKSFGVGDVISVGGTTGIVQSIDLLSVKLRTFDNQYVRLPNETLIKTELKNVTRFPIRRLDIKFRVLHETDLGRLKETLLAVAATNKNCLDDPEPLFLIIDFDSLGTEVLFGVWFARETFLVTKNSVMDDVSRALAAEGIHIPLSVIQGPLV